MKLREYRQKNNLSQRELSNILKIPPTTLYSYEAGVCDPGIDTLIKLADFYHVSLDELVGRPTCLMNRNVLSERENSIIDKLLKMNTKQQELTEFYIDTMLGSM
ncbi:MAG: helix-turn-helix domain-containing protein [Candidatus Onthoplasma sp.]